MAPIKVVKTYPPSKKLTDARKKRRKKREPLASLNSDANNQAKARPRDPSPISKVSNKKRNQNWTKSPRLLKKNACVGLGLRQAPPVRQPLFFHSSSSSEFSSINADTTFDKLLTCNKERAQAFGTHDKENVAVPLHSKPTTNWRKLELDSNNSRVTCQKPANTSSPSVYRQNGDPPGLLAPSGVRCTRSTSRATTNNTTATSETITNGRNNGNKLTSIPISPNGSLHSDSHDHLTLPRCLPLSSLSPRVHALKQEVLSPAPIRRSARQTTKWETSPRARMTGDHSFCMPDQPRQLQSTPLALKVATPQHLDDFSPISFPHQRPPLDSPSDSPQVTGFDEECIADASARTRLVARIVSASMDISEDMFPSYTDEVDCCNSDDSPLRSTEKPLGRRPTLSQLSSESVSSELKNCKIATATDTSCLANDAVASPGDLSTTFESAHDHSDITSSLQESRTEASGHTVRVGSAVDAPPVSEVGGCRGDGLCDLSEPGSNASDLSASFASAGDTTNETPDFSLEQAVRSQAVGGARFNRYSLRNRKVVKTSFVELDTIGEDELDDDDETDLCKESQDFVKPILHTTTRYGANKGLSGVAIKPPSIANDPPCQSIVPPPAANNISRQSVMAQPAANDVSRQSFMAPPAANDVSRQSVMAPPAANDVSRQSVMAPPAANNVSRQSIMAPPAANDVSRQSVMAPPAANDVSRQSTMAPPAANDVSRQSTMAPPASNDVSRQSTMATPAANDLSRQSVRQPRCSFGKPRHSIISRRYSHQVIPGKLINDPRPESLSFRGLHHIPISDSSRYSIASVQECNVLEMDESECAASESLTARDVVLQKCQQNAPVPFSEAYPDKFLSDCKKIGEGLYGEVFKWNDGVGSSVIKIIPIDGEDLVNGERQKKFDEILSEIVIAQELSGLRRGKACQTTGFVRVVQNWCVQGRYPQKLVDLWEEFAEEPGTENDCPTMFGDPQLFIVLELADGGTDLEKYVFNNSKQALSVFLQTAHSLAVAEASMEFEHRDLHWGNVLISQTNKKNESYTVNGQQYTVPTYGVQVSIIDFTLSRMTYDGCCIFNDLSLDPTLFMSQGDYQFEIYRKMKEECGNNWSQFKPYNNVLWLNYLIKKIIDGVHYKNKHSKIHREGIGKLKAIEKSLLKSQSAVHFILSCC